LKNLHFKSTLQEVQSKYVIFFRIFFGIFKLNDIYLTHYFKLIQLTIMSNVLDQTTDQGAPVMSVKDWLITYLIGVIPLVGFIMLFVWAFSSGHNPNKSNWAKAALIFSLIFIVLYFVLFLVFGAALLSGSRNF